MQGTQELNANSIRSQRPAEWTGTLFAPDPSKEEPVSLALYEDGLRSGSGVLARYQATGALVPLDVDRWQGPARGADETLLGRASGHTLDIGCGPGRFVAALSARGVPALGIDIAPAAVGLTRRAGGRALQLSVFDRVPGASSWDCAVLADGNIGIGGDPARLLGRVRELLTPRGRLLVELDGPGTGLRLDEVRLEDADGRVGEWFAWAHVAADLLGELAGTAGLRVSDQWCAPDPPVDGQSRWFAELVRG